MRRINGTDSGAWRKHNDLGWRDIRWMQTNDCVRIQEYVKALPVRVVCPPVENGEGFSNLRNSLFLNLKFYSRRRKAQCLHSVTRQFHAFDDAAVRLVARKKRRQKNAALFKRGYTAINRFVCARYEKKNKLKHTWSTVDISMAFWNRPSVVFFDKLKMSAYLRCVFSVIQKKCRQKRFSLLQLRNYASYTQVQCGQHVKSKTNLLLYRIDIVVSLPINLEWNTTWRVGYERKMGTMA